MSDGGRVDGVRGSQTIPRRRFSRLALAVGCGLASAAAHAQAVAPSQVTPSDLRPAPIGAAAIALPASPGLVPPANAANLSITLGNVVVEGGFPELAEPTRAITQGIVGRRVTLADIYAAASEIERAYGSAGYALVRIVVPPQRLDPHGPFKLVVIDGYIQSVEVKGVAERQRAVVAARLAPLIGKRHVKLADIERRALLAGDVSGLSLKSTLATGANAGATTLVLDSADRVVTGSLGLDNNLPSSLRNWEVNAGLQVNSALGLGEQFYLSATSGYDVARLFDATVPIQIFGGGFVMPIGIDGLTINPEYTNAITRPADTPGLPPTTGFFQRFDLRLSYPLVRTRRETLTLSSTLEWDQEDMQANGFAVDLYDDNYAVWRGKVESDTSLAGGAGVQATATLSQGLGGRTGLGSIVPLSQQGASPDFTKFDVTAHWAQPLPNLFSFALYGAAQTSFGEPLMISEQFSLDGPGAVSGFPTGTFVVDEGALGRAELGRTFYLAVGGGSVPLEPYLFGAGAVGFIDDPTVLQQATIHLATVGLGARATFNASGVPSGWDLGAEVGRYASDAPAERDGWRGNLSLSVRF